MIVPSAADAQRQPPINPLIEVQISTLAQLNLRKEATLSEIASLVSHQSAAYIQQGSSTETTFAGLDAVGLTLIDTPDNLLQQTVTFRLPDGRIGWMLGLGPLGNWADFAPSFDAMRASAVLISPTQYPVITLSPDAIHFAPGKLQFRLPASWIGATGKSGTALYHGAQDTLYQDGSGFANGAQLVIQAQPMIKGQDAARNLIAVIGSGPTKPETITVGTASNPRPAARVIVNDPATQQQVIFIAVPSADQSTVSILRWTSPAGLTGVTQPLLEEHFAVRHARRIDPSDVLTGERDLTADNAFRLADDLDDLVL